MTQGVEVLDKPQSRENSARSLQAVLKGFERVNESQLVLPDFFGEEVGSIVIRNLKSNPIEVSLK